MTTQQSRADRTIQFGGEGSLSGVDEDSIAAVLAELNRQKDEKADLIVSADALEAVAQPVYRPGTYIEESWALRIAIQDPESNIPPVLMPLNAHARAQLASETGIGSYYFNRLVEYSDEATMTLLAHNLNHWFQALGREGKRWLIRTLDDHIRSIHSDKYKVRDNLGLLLAITDPIQEMGAQITRIDLTPRRMYIRSLHPDWKERVERQQLDVNARQQIFQDWMGDLKANAAGEIPYFSRLAPVQEGNPFDPAGGARDGGFGLQTEWDDDWVIPGIKFENSEIGEGMTKASPFALRVICMNGTVMDAAIASRHVGTGATQMDGFISQETVDAENAAVFSAVKDLVRATFEPAKFKEMVAQMSAATNEVIEKPVQAVDYTIQEYGISPKRKQELLNFLIAGADPTRWGLINAVTAMARETDDQDERHELELVGGRMLARVRPA